LAREPFAETVPLRPPGADEFVPVFQGVRKAVTEQPAHPAWQVLEADRVERLLAQDPRSLGRSRELDVWRLATVFMNSSLEGRG
jgi:hypothetical protein